MSFEVGELVRVNFVGQATTDEWSDEPTLHLTPTRETFGCYEGGIGEIVKNVDNCSLVKITLIEGNKYEAWFSNYYLTKISPLEQLARYEEYQRGD